MSHPRVTIITVVYNGERVIEKTINSVLAQDYPNLEYIIIDGASNDTTLNIIEKYKGNLASYSETDKGVYDAMNKGIDKATGDWILFMNAGDTFFSPTVISEVMQSDILFDNYSVIYGDAEFQLKNIAYINEASDTVSTNQYMPFSHQAAFTRTSVAKQIRFDLKYKIAADTAFFLQLIKQGHSMKHVPIVICSYDALEGLSVNNEVARCREIVVLQAEWNGIDPNSSHFKQYIQQAEKSQRIRKILPNFIWTWLRERNIKKKHNRDKIRRIG